MSDDPFGAVDELGPAMVVHLAEQRTGLRATVVIDNVAAGPAVGGVRMAPDVTTAECRALARAMTLKNAAAGLAHGGGKAVIVADPRQPLDTKEALVRAFARRIADLADYIPGPDMGTDERAMAWVFDEIGRAVGLPAPLGGIPLDELGATGHGVAIATEVAAERIGLDLRGARVAVQGFGAVGRHAARFLAERGCVLVAAADSAGTAEDPSGIDPGALEATKRTHGSVTALPGASTGPPEAIVDVDCDIWIPAARPDVLRADNVDRLRSRLVVSGANIAITPEADLRLHERGVLSVPDFIANAGGVICAAVEYRNGTPAQAFTTITERIRANTAEVLDRAVAGSVTPRAAATAMATERLGAAMALRRHR
ncbi:MAG: Glu/Leu/Phe/Val dehydrogenase [Acidimicrobiales bacterium]|nr:Glu/Leu/Phe/Val dehydrogenase [Acidimicrobiales bacterium]